MGLDMYLTGEKYFTRFDGFERETTEGFEISSHHLSIGYWRKHPNLHGYIVENFANGDDRCQQIHLSPENLMQIMSSVKAGNLPHTEGFFFGVSDASDDQKNYDLSILKAAFEWLNKMERGVWKSVYYQASW